MAENLRRRRTAGIRGAGPSRARLGMSAVALMAASGAVLAGCGSAAPSSSREVSGTVRPAADGASPSASAGGASPSASGSGTASPGGATPSAPASGDGTSAATRGPASSRAPSGGHTTRPGGHAAGGRCHTSDLKASVGPNDPGAGQENFALVLRNTSGHTCTVTGFPGFAFVDRSGKPVAPDPQRQGGRKQVVRLAPGHSAWAALGFPNPGIVGGATVTPAAVKITPPDEKAFLRVAWSGGPVSKHPPATAASHVGPFQPGTGPGTPR
ncbi:DUF4232 domain-containing protein [Streptomyces sp. DW26H14]|uniref:DUF4232 domain-containing protein n=1 Tax=Streptomyces sp. DW26H14 TaxID=3435395 RepID=UPI00403D6EB7